MYDELCKSVNDAYRKAKTENSDIGIREFANSIGEDFLLVGFFGGNLWNLEKVRKKTR